MSAPKHYLSRLPDEDRREKPRRKTNKVATVYYMLHGVRGYSKQSCRMDNISENGCHVCRLLSEPIPDFMTDLPTELVDRIADKRFPAK